MEERKGWERNHVGLVGFIWVFYASFWKACIWKLASEEHNFNDLLFDVDSTLFACSTSVTHCLYIICYLYVILHLVVRWYYALKGKVKCLRLSTVDNK